MVIGTFAPLFLYWIIVGRAPALTPDETKELLEKPEARATLVDIRTPEEYAKGHLDGARSWPYDAIRALGSSEQVPVEFREKTLLLICDSGIQSGMAVRKLRALGVPDVLSVTGGMQDWVASARKPCASPFCLLRAASGEVKGLPFRESPLGEQWAAVVSGFGIKPLYTLLSLALAILLWRAPSPDLVALRWAMVFFFIGENLCALNVILYLEGSSLLEHLHSLGMVFCFGFATFALIEGIDLRLLKLTEPGKRCAALGLCQGCIKNSDAPCGLQRTFYFLIPAVATVAAMPLFSEPEIVSYNTRILGTFYNYSHAVIHQLYETRFLPAAAIVLFGTSLLLLRWKGREPILWSKVFFAAGGGALSFSLFRWILFGTYQPNLVWFAFWEETTELLFVGGVAFVLWVFRAGLFRERSDT
jgi:rhodanese-related sulfurtransferase